jgi:hypothetical protein
MTPGPGHDPGAPDHARAETYLRLRVEAELRRVQALPRPDPLAESWIPAPLRGVVRLVLPLRRRAVTAVQPLAENAARTLQPLVDSAARTLQPLTDSAARTLQPLADGAARTLQPLAGQLAGAVLPAAEQAARRLHPLASQAADRAQTLRSASEQAARRLHPLASQAADRALTLRSATGRQLGIWPWRATEAAAPLRRTTADGPAQPAVLSAEEGLWRLETIAHGLAWAGAIDEATADSIVLSLGTALAARSRIHPLQLWSGVRRGMGQRQTSRPPAGAYRAAPVGVVSPTPPGSGLASLHLIAVVVAPDRAFMVVAGRVAALDARSQHRDPWPIFGSADRPTAIDDRGGAYQLYEDSGWSNDEGELRSNLRIEPVPPAGVQRLELTMSPGSAPIRVDLARAADERTTGAEPVGCPAERLIDTVTIDLLAEAIGLEAGHAPRHDLSEVADIVGALAGAGALAPATEAVGRLVALADRLGMDVPPALRTAGLPCGLPAGWASVLENDRRQDGPCGIVPAGVVLPELDGARFVLAGLRSDGAAAQLHVLAWGFHGMRGIFGRGRVSPWSWSASDDQGRWHILTKGSSFSGDLHADLELEIRPPLHPDATSLSVTLAGRSGQVSATVPLDWREPL